MNLVEFVLIGLSNLDSINILEYSLSPDDKNIIICGMEKMDGRGFTSYSG